MTSKIANVHKHCWNLHHRLFISFSSHWNGNCIRRSFSYWHAKSWDCLLTHWLPMKSIVFLVETIWRYQFRSDYLRNKKSFLNFLLRFWNLNYILNFFNKNMTLIDFVSEDASISNILNLLKHCWNMDHSTFITFIDHCSVNWVRKSLSYWDAKS